MLSLLRRIGGERPVRFDALLMMYQTESLQTVGSRCEMDARFEHQNGVKQTVRRAVKIQEKTAQTRMVEPFFWQGQKDLNPRHAVLETAALPTELCPYMENGKGRPPCGLRHPFGWAFRDSNPGPTGYEPVALTN